MSVWVCGEALIDLLPEREAVGGGPFNTARALARLGRDVEFIGGISTDKYGGWIARTLAEDSVNAKLSHSSTMPTATAKVSINTTGQAEYIFSIDNTATFEFSKSWLPNPFTRKPQLLFVGSLATLCSPGADELFDWALEVSEIAPIVFDPNVRPSYLSDHDRYRAAVERWIGISSVVRMSDEDFSWLYPDENFDRVSERWVSEGVRTVILTKGRDGIIAISGNEVVNVESPSVNVVDTVGAGDCVNAVICDALVENGVLDFQGETLRKALVCAALSASITCTRVGADSPTKAELGDRKRYKDAVHRRR